MVRLMKIERLNIQHEYLKRHVYDGKLIYDTEVAEKLRNGGRVLDNGTGTGRFLAPNYHADADDEKCSRVGAGAIAGSSQNCRDTRNRHFVPEFPR